MSNAVPREEAQDLSHVRLYRPGIIALYFAIGGLPVGCLLYGLNVARRGDRLFGYILAIAGAGTYLLLVLAVTSGVGVAGFGLLALLVGLGVMHMERRPYRDALRRGARPARWWPPLVAVVAILVSVILIRLVASEIV
jgi:hypothetical protein